MTRKPTPEEFWNRLDDVRAGMLALGHGRPVPMSHFSDRKAHALWFIAADGTEAVSAVQDGPAPARYVIASGDGQLYARIDGRASLSRNEDKLDELWNMVSSAWFEGGPKDKDVRLIRVDLQEAEVWTTTGALGFLYEIGKANVTDAKPDVGEHGTLTFAA